tara:strand:+ start:846 stop:1514 length:669 start_codon:yes stop_codon:yes gene_type:complete
MNTPSAARPQQLIDTADTTVVDDEAPFPASSIRSRGLVLRLTRSRVSSYFGPRQPQTPLETVGVVSVVGTVTALSSMIETDEQDTDQISSEEPSKKTSDAFTQTPSTFMQCTAEHGMACDYIDKLVSIEKIQGELVPEDLLCPITHQAMRVPVVASDGHSYELHAIQSWVLHKMESPITREPLSSQRAFTRNRVLEKLTREWARAHAKTCLNDSTKGILHRF